MRSLSVVLALGALSCADSSGSTPPTTPGATDPSNPTPASTSDASAPPTPTSDAGADAPPAAKDGTGRLLYATGAPIVGASYTSGQKQGTTDASGTFAWEAGKPVTFAIGDVELGSTSGAPIVSPYQLVGSASCDDTDDLSKLVAFLAALDGNATPDDGVALPAIAQTGAKKTIAQSTRADLGAYAAQHGGRAIADADAGLRAFIRAFDGEVWTQTSSDNFGANVALTRGQGVATDGTSWFFSGTTGLERTDASFSSTASSAIAIPLDLALAGSNHIGDIDVYGGKIFAPIEDKNYASPKVVLFDANTLGAGTVFSIPQALQTKGVPWIAVDGPKGVAYMAEWDPTPGIHVYSSTTLAYQRTIAITPSLGRVQGGKVYKGQLYLSVDDATKHVYKVHLSSGTVITVLDLQLSGLEEEGLAFFARADGSLLHTLNVNSGRNGMELHHHKITREPLRWKVCP